MTTTRWMTVDDGVDVGTRIEELEALLKKTQKAVRRARMGYKRKSKAKPPAADVEDEEEADPAHLAKAKAANARRVSGFPSRPSARSSTAVKILQQRSSTSSSSSAPSQCEQLCVFTVRCIKSAFSA